MRVAIDAMGGDYAPQEIVKGAVMAARQSGVRILLVGPKDRIEADLSRSDGRGLDIEIVHTDEYLVEGEHAALTLRKKRNASILLAVRLVKEGRADAAVGAGPTGGVYASALQVLGTIEGISRPVIGGQVVGFAPGTIMLDLGGNVDSRPGQLLDFAIVGSVYARRWMGIPDPTVALLSNGKEEGKGNDVVKQAYELFKRSGLNFIGNVEGNDVAAGKANIVVCDGFVGNCVIKFREGLGEATVAWLESTLRGRLPGDQVEELSRAYQRALMPAHGMGGVLWAVNGVVCKTQGHSRAADIARAVATAKRAVELDLVGAFKAELAAVRGKLGVRAVGGRLE